MSRRGFLAAAGGAAAAASAGLSQAAHVDLLGAFAPSLPAAEAPPPARPVVNVVYIRPEKPMVVSWPGGNCDTDAQQALFTKTLREAAKELDVQLDVQDKPAWSDKDLAAYLAQLQKSPPDGLIVGAMCLFGWDRINKVVQNRGDVPAIVYSNLSGFTSNLQCGRNVAKTFVGATQDVAWLATALRMLHTIWRMKHARILVVAGGDKEPKDTAVPGLGTSFRQIAKARFQEEFKKVQADDDVRAMADAYAKGAQKILEPTKEDIVEAAKNYVVCRRLLKAYDCHGLSVDCLGWKNPVCLSFSRLIDEGVVAGCEADREAALSMLLIGLLCNRPGFIQDPSPNTINNTLIGAHCTSATRLEGFDKPYRAPYLLRNYHTRTGVSPQVLWPVGKDVTVMEFAGPGQIIVGTGRVRSNIPQPPSGCCRTAVEVELDNVADTRDVKGFHQLFVLGKHDRVLRAYGSLAGIKVVPIA